MAKETFFVIIICRDKLNIQKVGLTSILFNIIILYIVFVSV